MKTRDDKRQIRQCKKKKNVPEQVLQQPPMIKKKKVCVWRLMLIRGVGVDRWLGKVGVCFCVWERLLGERLADDEKGKKEKERG